jgi:hypothetical protein
MRYLCGADAACLTASAENAPAPCPLVRSKYDFLIIEDNLKVESKGPDAPELRMEDYRDHFLQ